MVAINEDETESILGPKPPEQKSSNGPTGGSLPSVAMNSINAIVGSGLIAMPFAVMESGLILGCFGVILSGFLTFYTTDILTKAGSTCDATTYQDCVYALLGRIPWIILTFVQFAFPLISMTSYYTVVADTVPKVMMELFGIPENSIFINRHFVIVVCAGLVTLPLSLYRNIDRLAKASFLSIVILLFVMGSVCIRFREYQNLLSKYDETIVLYDWNGFVKSMTMMATAFMYHHNIFVLYRSQENPTPEKWTRAVLVSVSFSSVFIFSFSVVAFANFSRFTQGDILNNYCWDDTLMNISRFLFCIVVLLTYPLECFVCREVLVRTLLGEEYVDIGEDRSSGDYAALEDSLADAQAEEKEGKRRSKSIWTHSITAVFVALATCLISLSTDCLSSIVHVNGTLNAVPLAYIFPGLCYIKSRDGPWYSGGSILAVLVTGFGVVCFLKGILDLAIDGTGSCVVETEMEYCLENTNTTFVKIVPLS